MNRTIVSVTVDLHVPSGGSFRVSNDGRKTLTVHFGPQVLEVGQTYENGVRTIDSWPWENVARVTIVDKEPKEKAPLPPPSPRADLPA